MKRRKILGGGLAYFLALFGLRSASCGKEYTRDRFVWYGPTIVTAQGDGSVGFCTATCVTPTITGYTPPAGAKLVQSVDVEAIRDAIDSSLTQAWGPETSEYKPAVYFREEDFKSVLGTSEPRFNPGVNYVVG